MIPFETLLKTMEKFNTKFADIEKKCDAATKGGEEHMQWYKMQKAYIDLQNTIESKILPFVEE